MAIDVGRASLYSGRINLWVEDGLTRSYLGALWNDSAVKFLIGGGNQGVAAILRDAEDAGYTNVFGLVDQDHDRSNYPEWFDTSRSFRKFILPRHEIENYLLDTHALEGCVFNTRRLDAGRIDTILDEEAIRRCWWAACRDVISEIRELFFDDFIPHPKIPEIGSETSATDYIVSHAWFGSLSNRATGLDASDIDGRLKRAYHIAVACCLNGDWRKEFPGKEFLRLVGGRIYDRSSLPHGKKPSASEFDNDLAKAVARWQVDQGKVPSDLDQLLDALKKRIGE